MPNAVTHILIAIIIVDLFRDYIIKEKKNFSLHYIFLAGIMTMLPDLDYIFTFFSPDISPTYTHNLLIPAIIFCAAMLFKNKSKTFLSKKNKTAFILLLIASAYFIHLVLDMITWDTIALYPLGQEFGLGIIPNTYSGFLLLEAIDAVILLLWLWHEEAKHKIIDFI